MLKDTKCNKKVIEDLQRLFKKGSPDYTNTSSTHNNFIDFFRYGNHTRVDINIEKILKTINKEDRNQYIVSLPNILARFIPNLYVTPQGLVIKEGKLTD